MTGVTKTNQGSIADRVRLLGITRNRSAQHLISFDFDREISRGEGQGNTARYRIVIDILIVELCQGTRWGTSFPPLLALIVSVSDNSRSPCLRLGFFLSPLLFFSPRFPSYFSPFFAAKSATKDDGH